MRLTPAILLWLPLGLLPARGDEAIPAKTLAEIKGATAFVKVTAGPLQATGSGFLIRADGKTGYLVTNHHVVVHGPAAQPQPTLSVVFWSGTKKERVYTAALLAADAERDLAILKVSNADDLPAPLDLTARVELSETLPVFTFGFPFGQALSVTKGNPAMTVGKATVSSIRTNERDEVVVVQIDGELNPGNSGGPVVDARGRLVGVAVAKLRGTHIGFAIPPQELNRLLEGRVGALRAKPTRIDDRTTELEVEVALLDPLNRLRELELHYQPADALKDKPKADQETQWALMSGAARAPLAVAGQRATGKVRLTAPEGKTTVPFVFQVACVRAEGKKLITELTTRDVPFGSAPVAARSSQEPLPPPIVLKEQIVQEMPEISSAVVGGSGRYLILHLRGRHRLAVWDVYQSKMVKELPVAADQIYLAAGSVHLIVILPVQKLIQRYSLKTFEREATVPLKVRGTVTGAVMGSASDRPLLLGVHDDASGAELAQFLDPLTLKPLEMDWGGGKVPGLTGSFLRASANGQVFTARQGVGGEPHECLSLVVSGNQVKAYSAGMASSLLLPTPDGRHVCADAAVYDQELKPVFPLKPGEQLLSPFLPARQGIYYLRLEHGSKEGLGKLSFYVPGQDKPFTTLDDVEGYVGQVIAYGKLPNALMHDQRIFFFPDANVLVTIPLSNDKLIVRPFDLDKYLQTSGQEYLFVASQPSRTTRAGDLYKYQVVAKSHKGGLKYKVESGPKGMKVSEKGLLEWEVPKRPEGKEHEVVLGIADAAGQECFQTFTITIE
jgi:hypothetical protein